VDSEEFVELVEGARFGFGGGGGGGYSLSISAKTTA